MPQQPPELTPEQVAEMEAALAAHYNEPVRPVSQYCQAFRVWRAALREAIERGDFDERGELGLRTKEHYQEVIDGLAQAELAIYKSNLLARLIYGGQELRTEKCPVHQGHWSGWAWGDECECQDGPDITGWLPVKPPGSPSE